MAQLGIAEKRLQIRLYGLRMMSWTTIMTYDHTSCSPNGCWACLSNYYIMKFLGPEVIGAMNDCLICPGR